MASLFFRNLFFTLLQPGIVAGLIPYILLPKPIQTEKGIVFILPSSIFLIIGCSILLLCIVQLAKFGKGTLSPADPTKQLVVQGLYKYSRNPMYLGVLCILTCETLLFGSFTLLLYSLCIAVMFHTFITFFEEKRLLKDFGDAYIDYCKIVKRWF